MRYDVFWECYVDSELIAESVHKTVDSELDALHAAVELIDELMNPANSRAKPYVCLDVKYPPKDALLCVLVNDGIPSFANADYLVLIKEVKEEKEKK